MLCYQKDLVLYNPASQTVPKNSLFTLVFEPEFFFFFVHEAATRFSFYVVYFLIFFWVECNLAPSPPLTIRYRVRHSPTVSDRETTRASIKVIRQSQALNKKKRLNLVGPRMNEPSSPTYSSHGCPDILLHETLPNSFHFPIPIHCPISSTLLDRDVTERAVTITRPRTAILDLTKVPEGG